MFKPTSTSLILLGVLAVIAVAYAGPGEAPATAASSARDVMPSFGKIRYR
jgi:hypothetical protein